ncbi:MAG TPA: NUDIX domain-containing protein [Candidatus Sulfopaludibacter sp.]|jgi:predicted NUDIX family NTP pyrophosphohydrolase|nr:NUDIX domain-containing protein [Candidatus Sulfopaludibacter sp.]
MAKCSAGLLMFRRTPDSVEVLLVHPGGPFFRNKDLGSWSIPKGEYPADEDPLSAARREFEEETGLAPAGDFRPLGQIRQAGGKLVTAWAFEGDCDPATLHSNSFSLEWPRGSGKLREFPEVDRIEWFPLPLARQKILAGQSPFLDRLLTLLGGVDQSEPRP